MRSRNHKGNVFVGNLPTDFSDERLAEAFDPFGMVLSAAIARDPNTGAKLRYGFVDIATEKAAKAAKAEVAPEAEADVVPDASDTTEADDVADTEVAP